MLRRKRTQCRLVKSSGSSSSKSPHLPLGAKRGLTHRDTISTLEINCLWSPGQLRKGKQGSLLSLTSCEFWTKKGLLRSCLYVSLFTFKMHVCEKRLTQFRAKFNFSFETFYFRLLLISGETFFNKWYVKSRPTH